MDPGGPDPEGTTMKHLARLAAVFFFFGLVACSDIKMADATTQSDAPSELILLGDDLRQLKDDFNANQGRVRLLFLSGPTCGICLRGMADLNDEFLAASQDDERLVTFVVHVPTMGANENHARDSIPLLDGPRIHHYWEETGIIGQHFSEVMDVDMYVWDFWAIYGPDHVWNDTLPPLPDYFEHQLGVTSGKFRGFPRELVLDAERFAAQTRNFVNESGEGAPPGSAATVDQSGELLADGTFIPKVGQPRNVAVRQHIMGRGGYKNLKRIQAVTRRGQIEANGKSYELTTVATRPNDLQRTIDGYSDGERGMPGDLEQLLLATFEFDGLFVEWPDKGHEVAMSGMLKIGDVLAWRLHLDQSDGPEWYLYLDSHSGDLVRADILNNEGAAQFIIRQSDFREVSGFVFAHRIEYQDSNEQTLAIETINNIEVNVEEFDMDEEEVAH